MVYPKLLIINSYSFNDYKGGGITLKNLFLGWPKERIAIAHLSDSQPMINVCEKYYKIGYNESQYIFPLNKISTEPLGKINGPYTVTDFILSSKSDNNTIPQTQFQSTNIIKNRFLNLITQLGIREFVHPLQMSMALRKWILDFNPEIIYCQPENISFINLVLKAQRLTNSKIVVHVMDDWPYLVYKDKSLKFVLRTIVNRKFHRLLKLSSLRLGISKAMADEFQTRYKLPFKYFHNPIDISNVNDSKSSHELSNDSYVVVYSGRIGWTASHDSIIEFSKCVEELRKEGVKIIFNIYTDLSDRENDFTKFKHNGTNLLPALKDDNYITKLQEADLLLYPVDFDKKSIEFIRLSFPTKLPSYLVSGTPVFCYGPSVVYSINFMTENKLGFICSEQKPHMLKQAVIEALSNNALRYQFSSNALIYAKSNFEATKIRSSFHEEIANCI